MHLPLCIPARCPSRYYPPMSIFRAVLVLLAASALTGCQSLAYYGQAIKGQSAMVLQRQSIPRLLADEKTAPALRLRLETVQRIRAFASSELGLPAARQYDRYVELGRSYPVWSVMAAPELSLTPRQWCYALVGCLNYRGFFSEVAAQREGDRLAAQGMDVYVSGVPAYSTLGWFRDPVLSSFVGWPEPELAE
ncbi:MAG: aminopeptidase, partial [Moraxellaceae bacterium]|nr:aminopeptidase [Moraxellaceae bacterium]